MKRINNNDLLKKLDSKAVNPKPASQLSTIADQGFRSYMADIIVSDKKRRDEIKQK